MLMRDGAKPRQDKATVNSAGCGQGHPVQTSGWGQRLQDHQEASNDYRGIHIQITVVSECRDGVVTVHSFGSRLWSSPVGSELIGLIPEHSLGNLRLRVGDRRSSTYLHRFVSG